MEQAVKLAVTVENVEKHKQMVGGSRNVFANRKEIEGYTCNQSGHYARDFRQKQTSRNQGHSYNCGSPNRRDGQVNQERLNRSSGQTSRNPAEKRRYLPEGSTPFSLAMLSLQQFGHPRRECPNLSQKARYPNGQGSTYRSLTSSQQQKESK
jgi:hypothetical protein